MVAGLSVAVLIPVLIATFTLRERDSMSQRRITEAELFQLLAEQVY